MVHLVRVMVSQGQGISRALGGLKGLGSSWLLGHRDIKSNKKRKLYIN